MYDNPLLTALFDESKSIPSSRLVQARGQFNSSNKFILVVPSTPSLIHVPPDMLYQDTYLLSHVVQLEPNPPDSRQPFNAPTLTTGWTLAFNESSVAGIKGFPSQDPIPIVHTYTWNPGVPYISSEQVFYVVEIERTLVPSPKQAIYDGLRSFMGQLRGPRAIVRGSVEDTPELEDMLVRKRGQRSKASAILGPLLTKFDVDSFEEPMELADAFRSIVDQAASQLVDLGIDSKVAVHEYFEYQLSQRIFSRLQELLDHSVSLELAQEQLDSLDITQLGLPPGIDWHITDGMVNKASTEIEKLSGVIIASEISAILLEVMSILSTTPSGQAISADHLIGLLVLAILRAKSFPHTDVSVFYSRHFSQDGEATDSGHLGYALLTFESVMVHLRQEVSKLGEISDANADFWEAFIENAVSTNGEFDVIDSAIGDALATDRSVPLTHYKGGSCLFYALKHGNAEIIHRLATKWSDVYTRDIVLSDRDSKGMTLLMVAIETENGQAIEYLLDVVSGLPEEEQKPYLCLKDDDGRTVAHLIHHSDELITAVGHLLDWTSRDKRGMSPLSTLSVCYDHPSYDHMISLALAKWSKTPNVSLYDHFDKRGNSLMHTLNPSSTDLLDKFFEMPDVDVNWLNDKGQSPLMLAARFDRELLVRYLLKNGGNIWQRDNSGLTVFDLSKGKSTKTLFDFCEKQRQGTHAWKTSLVNGTCYFTISDGNGQLSHRSMEDLHSLRVLLQNAYPSSWVPPLTSDNRLLLDPWKTYRYSMKLVGYSVDYFLRVVTNLESFKDSDDLQAFLGDKEWSPSGNLNKGRPSRDGTYRQKTQNVDGTERVGYSANEADSIITFFEFSIDQLKTLQLSFIRLSTAHRRLLNAQESLRSITEYVYTLAVRFDYATLNCTLPEMLSRSRHPGITIQVPQNMYMVSQARSTASLMDMLEKPVKLIEELRQEERDLEQNRVELSRLGSIKAWPLAYFEEKRVLSIQDTEAAIFSSRAKIMQLTRSIAASHDALATDLSSFNRFQGEELMAMMASYTRDILQSHRDLLSRFRRAHSKLQLQKDRPDHFA